MHFEYKVTYRLKVNVQKNIYYANTNDEKAELSI